MTRSRYFPSFSTRKRLSLKIPTLAVLIPVTYAPLKAHGLNESHYFINWFATGMSLQLGHELHRLLECWGA